MSEELPQYWFLCDDPEWKELSVGLWTATELLIELRLMSYEGRMKRILHEMKMAEMRSEDVTPIYNQYQDLMNKKQTLKTQEGKNQLHSEVFESSYMRFRTHREEVLPL